MIKAGINTGSQSPKMHGIRVNSSVFGKTVNLIMGLTLSAPDLIWYNGWKSHSSPVNTRMAAITNQSGSKKGSKKGGVKYYSAAVDLLLGHAPLAGVLSAWQNNVKLGVLKSSASGVISGGQFSFSPVGGASKTVISATVPSSPPYTFQAPNFVADVRVRIDYGSGGYDNAYLTRVDPSLPPGAMEYSVTGTGLYTFNVAQAGNALRITYFKTVTGTAGTLAGIYAVTVHENYKVTFNDYGAPGSVTKSGTWERPLWNATFGVPGNYTNPNSGRLRDPYTWWYDGVTPTINVPPALEGTSVTVYYGLPVIFKSDGTFYSNQYTPLQILNLEFERVLGSGAEYANFTAEQIVQAWVSGCGSVEFDLGTANAMPNLNFEVIGAFTLWPSGDCDVVDVITDIAYSGPVTLVTGY